MFKANTESRIDDVLEACKLVSSSHIHQALADQWSLSFIDLDQIQLDAALNDKLDVGLRIKHTLIPCGNCRGQIAIAASDPDHFSQIRH